MFDFLTALPSFLQILVWVAGAVLLTYFLMVLIHRAIPLRLRHEHNEVIGFIIAVIAVFYALLLASVLVIAIGHFDHARAVVEKEANLIGDVVRNARAISPQIEASVTQLARKYLDDIFTKEWPLQKQGKTATLGLQTLTALNHSISQYEPQNQRQSAYYSALIQRLNELYDARRERVFRADEALSVEIWVVALTGGILTICLVLLFGIQHRQIHFLLASVSAISLALIFALISIFDKPFQGDMSVSDEPYRLVRRQID